MGNCSSSPKSSASVSKASKNGSKITYPHPAEFGMRYDDKLGTMESYGGRGLSGGKSIDFNTEPFDTDITVNGKPKEDCTQDEFAKTIGVQFKNTPGPDGTMDYHPFFKENVPWGMLGHVSKAPVVGDTAVDALLHFREIAGGPIIETSVFQEIDAMEGEPVVGLLFFNLSCPIWRKYAEYMIDAFTIIGVPIVPIYIRESHPCDEFPAPASFQPPEWDVIKAHKSLDDRWKWAAKAKAMYRLPKMFVDSLDNKLALTYEAGAFRGFIVDRASKGVVHSMCFGPANVAGKLINLARFSEQQAAEHPHQSTAACSFKLG